MVKMQHMFLGLSCQPSDRSTIFILASITGHPSDRNNCCGIKSELLRKSLRPVQLATKLIKTTYIYILYPISKVCKIICVTSIAPIGIEPIEKYGRSQDYTLVTLRDRRGCTLNTDDVPSSRINTTSRLKELRDLMRSKNISAYIIPNSDDHQTEIVGPVDQRRHYISGFSGTNGDAVVTLTSAALWTDSRYDLQADEQLDCNWLLMKTALQSIPNIPVWLSTQLIPGSVVSVDGKKINFSQWQKWYNYLSTYQLTLYAANENLVDTVWKNRPSYPTDPLIIHDIKYAGETWQNKLSRLRNIFSQLRVDFQIVTALDEIAWLLNLRGNDIPFSPLFRSYLIVGKTWATLYLPQGKINQQIRSHLYTKNDYVFVKSYDWIWYDLMTLAKTMYYYTILVPSSINSSKGASYLIHSLVPSEKVLSIPSPIVNMKANKNSVEVSGIKKAHIRDAVALCQLWYEMEKDLAAGIAWDELKVVRKLIELRAEQPLNRGASFSSIVAFGTNGALPHYIPTPDTNKRIDTSGMLTIDSGGQYLDGTIDTTRVLHFGTPTREQQNIYTSLLKGCIDLVTSEFKPGTTMQELEPILRRPLLEMGLNYGHGSTHGTGMFLTVHESFNYTYDINFIGSQEPGYYKENEFGMRLENLVQVKEVPVPMNSSQNQLFTFEAVTLVPYENKLINSCSLDKKKKKWLFSYYVIIRSLVGGEMVKQGRHDLYRWLIDKTDPTFKCYEPLPKVME